MIQNDWVLQDERVCKQAAEFIRLYYDVMDRKRERTLHMYLEDGNLVWNGNAFQGADAIAKFLTTFPTTQHTIVSLDAQKVPMAATGAPQDFIVVTAAGSVCVREGLHAFTETFTLIMDGTTLKVKTQKFRYVD